MQKENEECSEHFNIIVNARQHLWKYKTINYPQIIDLAFPSSHGPNEIFTVQCSRGPKENREGTLVDGQDIEIKSGMVFDIVRTDKS